MASKISTYDEDEYYDDDYYHHPIIFKNIENDYVNVPFLKTSCCGNGKGLLVEQSTLGDAAGLGVFATRDFVSGEVITYYDGYIMTESLIDKTKKKFGERYGELEGQTDKYIDSHRRYLDYKKAWILGNFNTDFKLIKDEQKKSLPPHSGLGAFINDDFKGKKYNVDFFRLTKINTEKKKVDDVAINKKLAENTKDAGTNTDRAPASTFQRVERQEISTGKYNTAGELTNADDIGVFVVTRKEIKKGDELFVNYGSNYPWKLMGFTGPKTKESISEAVINEPTQRKKVIIPTVNENNNRDQGKKLENKLK